LEKVTNRERKSGFGLYASALALSTNPAEVLMEAVALISFLPTPFNTKRNEIPFFFLLLCGTSGCNGWGYKEKNIIDCIVSKD